ncbi:TIGR03087 family PEP-CTERM/XrtA system glycosyltransferase [Rheinheimera sp. EpRS3]|uniref:TIGR03087 family PEP-CTERM/XrtA system glycosyltransferase n=1 Tax=Rheinheimera sp. EpRS3 TaxID=1712383 RepID=UPI0007483F2E|nr:TIGR03087 family PEP-CTERM/XrtA system glycosyltransferase [Rheinheimera sp. EpRS3]KUM52650.1 glycosyl transferase family 1 [Rheinheimera sp. EpRS3]
MTDPKPDLLLLVHRIPYPPNKGDKIRSFNLMKALSQHYTVHLGCFIDDPFDRQYIDTLSQWCATVFCVNQAKWRAKLCALSGFITNQAITLPYYFSFAMAAWVNATINTHKIKKVLVYSSSMAQYVDKTEYQPLSRVIDFVDIDSDKWRQYAEKSRGVKRWFYQREARLLLQYEKHICQRFNSSLFVSDDEASAFRAMLPVQLQHKVHSVLNGVDTDYFSPETPACKTEQTLPEQYIVFTGAMDYWANVDAVCWFCQNIWPRLKQLYPQLHFVIVGGKPSAEVRALSQQAGVVVTGRVDDVRPYISHARFAVAPMLIARGIQNKVLEAMAMNKAVVCSGMAMEGINAPASEDAVIAEGIEGFIRACKRQLDRPSAPSANRQWILQHFTWQQTLVRLNSFIHPELSV